MRVLHRGQQFHLVIEALKAGLLRRRTWLCRWLRTRSLIWLQRRFGDGSRKPGTCDLNPTFSVSRRSEG